MICGIPLYEYDHIHDWAKTHRHLADELTLLCDFHHKQKTLTLLTTEQVEAANADPYNIRHAVSAPFGLNFTPSDDVHVILGGDRFALPTDLFPVVVDNQPLIGFVRADDGLALHLHLRDRFNNTVLAVSNNELMLRTDAWDVEFTGGTLTLREAARRILLRIAFEPPNRVTISRAQLMCNGVLIDVTAKGVNLNRNEVHFEGNWWRTRVGLTVGYCPDFRAPMDFLRQQVDRYVVDVPSVQEIK